MGVRRLQQPKLMPLPAMARKLGVRAVYLRDEATAGRVPAAKVGDDFVFNPNAVEQALLERAKAWERDRNDS